MKLPYGDKAHISERKLTEYLLSPTHTVGRFKANYFQRLGYNVTNVRMFKQALLDIATSENILKKEISPFGRKFIINGKLMTPIGEKVTVRTIWIIERGSKIPRLITVYPV